MPRLTPQEQQDIFGGVKAVTALEGYDDLLIFTPSILIGGDQAKNFQNILGGFGEYKPCS